MNELNAIRSTLHPFTGLAGVCFTAAALLKFAGLIHAGSTVADLALLAIALLLI